MLREILAKIRDLMLVVGNAAMERRPCDPRFQPTFVFCVGLELQALRHALSEDRIWMRPAEVLKDFDGDFVQLKKNDFAIHAPIPALVELYTVILAHNRCSKPGNSPGRIRHRPACGLDLRFERGRGLRLNIGAD